MSIRHTFSLRHSDVTRCHRPPYKVIANRCPCWFHAVLLDITAKTTFITAAGNWTSAVGIKSVFIMTWRGDIIDAFLLALQAVQCRNHVRAVFRVDGSDTLYVCSTGAYSPQEFYLNVCTVRVFSHISFYTPCEYTLQPVIQPVRCAAGCFVQTQLQLSIVQIFLH